MRRPARAVAALLLAAALTACDSTDAGDGPVDAGTAEGAGDATLTGETAVELRDGIEAAPGTRVLGGGAGTTTSGWYAALDLTEATPREVAEFYREHLTALGFTVQSGTGTLTVVASRPEGAPEMDAGQPEGGPVATTRVRVDVVPRSGEVPGFVRLVAG